MELTALKGALPPVLAQALSSSAQVQYEWWLRPAVPAGSSPEVARVQAGGSAATVYAAGPDGWLAELRQEGWPPPASAPAGSPCLVVDTARQPRPGEAPPPPQLSLVGSWADGGRVALLLDPTRWCLSGTGVLASTPRQRTAALVQRDAASRGREAPHGSAAGFTPGVPMRPAPWPGPGGAASGLAGREQRWVEATERRVRSRAEMQQGDPHLQLSAPWMRADKRPRLLPHARQLQRREGAEQREAEGHRRKRQRLDDLERARHQQQEQRQQRNQQQRRQQQERLEQQEQQQQEQRPTPPGRRAGRRPPSAWWAAFDDAQYGKAPEGGPPWRSAWRRLRRIPAPRAHRFFMWQVLHGSLPVAARLAAQGRGRGHDRRCHHPACHAAGVAETISHALIDCPVAASVTAWAGRLWSAAAALPAPPPATAGSFLAADRAVWDPGGFGELWDTIRLAVAYFLWAARCSGRDGGRAVPAVAVAAQVVHYLRSRMVQDDIRARVDAREVAAIGGQWVPDRPVLTQDGFWERWGSVLCRHGPGPSHDLQLLLTRSHPVPLPSI
jgi:hypothetical protein